MEKVREGDCDEPRVAADGRGGLVFDVQGDPADCIKVRVEPANSAQLGAGNSPSGRAGAYTPAGD